MRRTVFLKSLLSSRPNIRLMWNRTLRSYVIFLIASVAALPSVGGTVSTPHVTAELLLDRSHVRPGEEFRLGLHLRMKEGWHTYWKHPGDSGEATTIDWVLPDGFTAGPILWPQPQRISMEPLTTYGYEGDVLLLVPMRAPATAVAGSSASMTANVYWMVCEKICIPEEVTLDIDVPIASEPSSPGASATLFDRSTAALPIPSDGWQIRAARRGDRIILRARSPEGFRSEQPGSAFSPRPVRSSNTAHHSRSRSATVISHVRDQSAGQPRLHGRDR